jgi:hypothetical protein
MAKLVMGIGTSHSPMLSLPHEHWPLMGERDKGNKELVAPPDGELLSYEQLLERADRSIAKELTPDVFRAKWERCQNAIATLGQTLAEARPDAVIIISDDQEEMLFEDNMPALAVYWGDSIRLIPWKTPESASLVTKKTAWGYGDVEMDVPVASGLAKHLIESLVDQEFDVAHLRYLKDEYGGSVGPAGYIKDRQVTEKRRFGLPHGWAFVIKRLMNNKPFPIVPVIQNTCYPPNQPTPRRSYAMGRALRQAIESWDSGKRVVVMGSGGLSHFVVDEELDQMVLKGFKEKNAEMLCNLPRHRIQSAASEIRNWVATAGASEELDFRLVDYVPVRRSLAGTGGGWCFGVWS